MTKEGEGEILMIIISFLESLFPIISIFSITLIGSIYSYAFVILIATFVLTTILIYKKEFHSLFCKQAQKDLLLTSFFITLLFLLLFVAMRYTTAGNVALLLFMQLLFSYLYFNLFGSQKMTLLHTIGAALMGMGSVIILFKGSLHFNIGDLLALIAAAIAPIANIYQRNARSYVSSVTILTYRNIVALPVVGFLAVSIEPSITMNAFIKALPYLLINGIFIYVIAKILWVEALHRISITKMSAMLAFAPIFTLILAKFFLNENLNIQQVLGVIPIILGGYLITKRVSTV